MKSRIGTALKVLYPNDFGEKPPKSRKKGFVNRRLSSFRNSVDEYGKLRIFFSLFCVFLIVSGLYTAYAYNRFTSYTNNILSAVGNIESEKQRRNDLINNLVPPTINYLVFERELFTHVAEIRKELTSLDTILDKKLSGDDLAGAMKTQMPTLTGIFENYPDLKASKPFADLMTELIETENRVAAARDSLNETIKIYNIYIKTVPAYLVAKALRFKKVKWFEADKNAAGVPDMKQLDSVNVEILISKELASKIGNYLSK